MKAVQDDSLTRPPHPVTSRYKNYRMAGLYTLHGQNSLMRFTINRGAIGPWEPLAIGEEEYTALARAKNFLTIAFSLERKFDMLLGNYLEYEEELLTLTLGYMISSSQRKPEALGTINRRLANVLTVARLYVDHVKHEASMLYGNSSPAVERITQTFSAQYDRLFGYRLLEAIRNYLQHKALAIETLTYSINHGDNHQLRYITIAHLNFDTLLADPEFKGSLKPEMEGFADREADVAPLMQEYIEGLSRVHTEIRTVLKDDLDASMSLIRETISRYGAAIGEKIDFAVAWRLDEDDFTEEKIEVALDAVDRLRRLYDKDIPIHLSRAYISNQH